MTTGFLKRIIPTYIEAKRKIIQLIGSDGKDPFWEKRRMDQITEDLDDFITWLERHNEKT